MTHGFYRICIGISLEIDIGTAVSVPRRNERRGAIRIVHGPVKAGYILMVQQSLNPSLSCEVRPGLRYQQIDARS